MGSLLISTILRPHFVCLLILAYFSSTHPLCHVHEMSSLLQFKGSFAIDKSASGDPSAYPKVSSWTQGGSSDCCLWDGVECDEETSHVISLDLSSSFLYGNIDSNSSLFKLVHLQSLNLADNNFNYSRIPTAIKHLPMLTYLNLSASVFSGQIPSEISGLSNLSYLDLSSNYYDSDSGVSCLKLITPDLKSFIQNLTSLRELSLSDVNISSTLPTLLVNFSSLTSLILSDCRLKGKIPIEIFQLPNLQILNVQFNDLTGELPHFNQISALEVLILEENSFSGVIPFSVGNLKQLKYLHLGHNKFSGPIPSSFGNLTQLIELVLRSNHFSGSIPLSFSKLRDLETLNLNDNDLRGIVDFDMFLRLKNLAHLSLSYNNLSILIRPSIDRTPPQFRTLKLSFCNLSIFPDFLRHQVRMEILRLRGNNIGGPIPEWLMNVSRETLRYINLAENFLTGKVSPTICNFRSLAVLKLFANKLVGELPLCLGNFSDSLTWLDLSNNSFSGSIPTFAKGSQLTVVDLGHNQLQGKLPPSLVNCKKLRYLAVENNQLDDVFPYWLGSLPELQILVLRSNKFHGVVEEPQTELEFLELHIIDISYNNFTGKMPSAYFKNWKAMKNSSARDLRYLTTGMWNHEAYLIYSLSSTITIKGVTIHYDKINDELSIIDLSNNNFGGEIPHVIGELKGLHALDLSNNNLTGGIPSALANLTALESLDLSQNKLSGGIPQELMQLTFLQYFNVSHNRLTGRIPQANQFATFGNSAYESNAGLCGIPLPNKCENHSDASGEPLPSFQEDHGDDSGSPFQFGWKVVAIGYGCGFIAGVFIGHVVITRKFRWFAMTFRVRNLHVRRKRRMTPQN